MGTYPIFPQCGKMGYVPIFLFLRLGVLHGVVQVLPPVLA